MLLLESLAKKSEKAMKLLAGVCRVSESRMYSTAHVSRVSESLMHLTAGVRRVSESLMYSTTRVPRQKRQEGHQNLAGVCRVSDTHILVYATAGVYRVGCQKF